MGLMSRNDTHWGFTSVEAGGNEQTACYNVKSGHVDPLKCKISHLGDWNLMIFKVSSYPSHSMIL